MTQDPSFGKHPPAGDPCRELQIAQQSASSLGDNIGFSVIPNSHSISFLEVTLEIRSGACYAIS